MRAKHIWPDVPGSQLGRRHRVRASKRVVKNEKQVSQVVFARQGARRAGAASPWGTQAGKALLHDVRPPVWAQNNAVYQAHAPDRRGLGAVRVGRHSIGVI